MDSKWLTSGKTQSPLIKMVALACLVQIHDRAYKAGSKNTCANSRGRKQRHFLDDRKIQKLESVAHAGVVLVVGIRIGYSAELEGARGGGAGGGKGGGRAKTDDGTKLLLGRATRQHGGGGSPTPISIEIPLPITLVVILILRHWTPNSTNKPDCKSCHRVIFEEGSFRNAVFGIFPFSKFQTNTTK